MFAMPIPKGPGLLILSSANALSNFGGVPLVKMISVFVFALVGKLTIIELISTPLMFALSVASLRLLVRRTRQQRGGWAHGWCDTELSSVIILPSVRTLAVFTSEPRVDRSPEWSIRIVI